MNRRRRDLLALALASFALPAFALDDAEPDDALASVQGEWRGTLTYRDYRQPDRSVTVPTRVFVALGAPTELVLHYVFDDGPGKVVHSYESMRFEFGTGRVAWTSGEKREASILDITLATNDGPARRVVFERSREKHVDRFTMTFSATTLELSKDELGGNGTPSFRNRFSFTRG